MLVVYHKIPEAQIREEAESCIAKVNTFFAKRPKRRVCRAEFWYGKVRSIRRGHVVEDVNAARDEAIG
jgi:hypothetical protein